MTTAVTLQNQTEEDVLNLVMFQDITNKDQLGDEQSVFIWQVIPPVQPKDEGMFACSDNDAFEVQADAQIGGVQQSAALPIPQGDTNAIYGLYQADSEGESLSLMKLPDISPGQLQIGITNNVEGELDFAITRNGKPTFREEVNPNDTLVTEVFSPGLYVICVPEGVKEGSWIKLSERLSNIASVQPGESLKVIRTADGLQVQAQ